MPQAGRTRRSGRPGPAGVVPALAGRGGMSCPGPPSPGRAVSHRCITAFVTPPCLGSLPASPAGETPRSSPGDTALPGPGAVPGPAQPRAGRLLLTQIHTPHTHTHTGRAVSHPRPGACLRTGTREWGRDTGMGQEYLSAPLGRGLESPAWAGGCSRARGGTWNTNPPKSQTHRLAWVGRELKAHLPPALPWESFNHFTPSLWGLLLEFIPLSLCRIDFTVSPPFPSKIPNFGLIYMVPILLGAAKGNVLVSLREQDS